MPKICYIPHMRTDATELPDLEELRAIIAKEAKRDIPTEKIGVHFCNFTTICDLLEAADLDASFFRKNFTLDDLTPENRGIAGTLVGHLTEKLLQPRDTKLQQACDRAFAYLAEEDQPSAADCIFVFGSSSQRRIEKAVELFHQGYAPSIVISGNKPFYQGEQIPEADQFGAFAVSQGVPKTSLILENRSITTADNVKSSLNLFDAQGLKFKKIILVNSPFAQRRGYAFFKKFSDAELVRVNAAPAEDLSREHWLETERSIRIVINEFFKLKIAVALESV